MTQLDKLADMISKPFEKLVNKYYDNNYLFYTVLAVIILPFVLIIAYIVYRIGLL